MSKDVWGPAFPIDATESADRCIYTGMTLRDYFAAQALKSILYADRVSGIIGVNNYEQNRANDAYQMADAMLKARQE